MQIIVHYFEKMENLSRVLHNNNETMQPYLRLHHFLIQLLFFYLFSTRLTVTPAGALYLENDS